jgi:hypothetical protein
MKTKKSPVWVEKTRLEEVKDLLTSKKIPFWGEYGVFYFNFGTAIVTTVGMIILGIGIYLLN